MVNKLIGTKFVKIRIQVPKILALSPAHIKNKGKQDENENEEEENTERLSAARTHASHSC